jgi:hypothetical protein
VHLACAVITLLLVMYADSLTYVPFQGTWAITSGPSVESVEAEPPPAGYTWLDRLRWFLTSAINTLYIRTQARGDIYLVLGGLAGLHAGAWLIGLPLMPFIAAGERPGRLYLRAVKLTLWSTVCFIPPGLVILVVVYVRHIHEIPFEDLEWESVTIGTVALWVLWWLTVLLRLGDRYAGPAEGPGWQPRQPCCNRCGYILTGLSVDGRCPECGLAVHASLPEARRPSPWAAVTLIRHKPAAYLSTLAQVLRGRQFFRTLAVYPDLGVAVRFAWWTVFFTALLCVAGLAATADPYVGAPLQVAATFASVSAIAVLVPSIVMAVVALRACQFGRRDPRPTTAAVCYGSALFLPVVVALWIGIACLLLAEHAGWFGGLMHFPLAGWIDYGFFWALGLSVLPIAALTWALLRLRRALHDVRFASA